MTTQNTTNTLTQRVILSAAFNPEDPDSDDHLPKDADGNLKGPASTYMPGAIVGGYSSSPQHWQDTVADGIMTLDMGTPGHVNEHVGNEYELDVERLTHTFQTSAAVMPLPGMANVLGSGTDNHNSAQITAISLDLGMMREIITVNGVLIDRDKHPQHTYDPETDLPITGHPIRRQHLLDIARTQWANVHGWNRLTKFSWSNPNKFPALTIGPMHGRSATGTNRDGGYYGDEPFSDVRGNQLTRGAWSGSSFDSKFDYKGRRRYRGLIRRLTLTQIPGQPDVWRFQFDFEIVKNELEQRQLTPAQADSG